MQYLDFEKEVKSLDDKINSAGNKGGASVSEAQSLIKKRDSMLSDIYSKLEPWDIVEVSRHPNRPHTVDYIAGMVSDFVELRGDRMFSDDQAIVGGIGYINERPIMIIGEEKGNDTETRLRHNFGSPKPEGYRKAMRLTKLADKFNLPIVYLIDTAGAFPGKESEERNISASIAESIQACLDVSVPTISIVIGEGGSGGAIAIGVANKVMMLKNSIYSVISPEGCAAILWKSADSKKTAAEALRLTSGDLKKFGVIDEIIEEPLGGAHRDRPATIRNVKAAIDKAFKEMSKLSPEAVKAARWTKFENMTRKI
ncbi:MAG: acetyl-CoA carboxylase carboxyltransferase subunit alpha [Alphaproteobacteria bacterium]|nr:acetyl-CoA carboxylase carboxyltransferase subunit alpha [Alphaproteobacteria bacterium]